METHTLIQDGFLASVSQFPERPALEVDRATISYRGLYELAGRIASTIYEQGRTDEPPLTALFAYRSATAFAGVLGILLRGHGYVPLNRTFPVQRNRCMLEQSGCNSLVVDQSSAGQLDKLLEGFALPLVVLLPDHDDVAQLAALWPQHRFLSKRDIANAKDFRPVRVSPDSIAYLLFTSGSTGTPKGVMVMHRNVRSYLDSVAPRCGITESDRCSQTFDMTFDLSVHDMFVTWEKGACLCCPSQKTLINPGKFINQSQLTTWFSVPSTVVFMKKLGTLKPGTYPSLRLSLFCGEALPMEVVRAWAEAAPNSRIENIYGPTELTIACTAYCWDRDRSPSECHLGIVPIGEPFYGMDAIVVDEDLKEVPLGNPGELLVTGKQLTPGYWRDGEKTAKSFVVPSGKHRTYYRTGDRVLRAAADKPLVYLGRVDNQIKVLGHRVELGEIEAVAREESGVDGVVAVGWPLSPSGADGIEVFLQTDQIDLELVQARIAARLPSYMTPRNIHLVPEIPLNSNGKFDRRALIQRL
jgi:amino acid adenylation domain-containing protein